MNQQPSVILRRRMAKMVRGNEIPREDRGGAGRRAG